MLTLWHPYSDWNFGNLRRTLSAMEEVRREMGMFLSETPRLRDRGGEDPWCSWPRASLRDNGDALVVSAEVPGLSDKDLEITITGDTVAIRGERKADVPEGYSVHRKERSAFKFSRSFLLPVKVNPDKVEATVKNGVLELLLPKAPESQPKRINVTTH